MNDCESFTFWAVFFLMGAMLLSVAFSKLDEDTKFVICMMTTVLLFPLIIPLVAVSIVCG